MKPYWSNRCGGRQKLNQEKTTDKGAHMAAVFTHSSICPSLLRPQSVFSAPGATLRADCFCKQKEREGPVSATSSQLFQGLTGLTDIWSMRGDGSLVRAPQIYPWPLEPDRTLTRSSEVCQKKKKTTFSLQSWLSVQHLHQRASAAGVRPSWVVWSEVNWRLLPSRCREEHLFKNEAS